MLWVWLVTYINNHVPVFLAYYFRSSVLTITNIDNTRANETAKFTAGSLHMDIIVPFFVVLEHYHRGGNPGLPTL